MRQLLLTLWTTITDKYDEMPQSMTTDTRIHHGILGDTLLPTWLGINTSVIGTMDCHPLFLVMTLLAHSMVLAFVSKADWTLSLALLYVSSLPSSA